MLKTTPVAAIKPIRILLLEDRDSDALLIEDVLAHGGLVCELKRVTTRKEVVEVLQSWGADLIISDYSLPSFGGMEALELRNRIAPNTPFILVSGQIGEEAAVEVLENGATSFVSKARMHRLAQKVEVALSQRAFVEGKARTESQLRESQERFQAISEMSTDYATSLAFAEDGSVGIEWMTESFEEVFGYSLEELEGMGGPLAMVHPDDAPLAAAQFERIKRGLIPGDFELRLVARDGTSRTVSSRSRYYWDDSKRRVVRLISAYRDLTDQLKAEADKEVAEARLRQAERLESLGRLTGGVAHDFNNILAVVMNYAQFLKDSLGSDDERIQDVEEIAKAATRGAGLVRQLLAFSRHDVSRPEVFQINDEVKDLQRMLESSIGEDIEFDCIFGDGLPSIMLDRAHMQQIVMNLTVNARDAMPQGGRLIMETSSKVIDQTSTWDPTLPLGNYVCLTVSDTGTGISAETLGHIFEPFFTTKGISQGTGLGLATVHGLMKDARGMVTVYSEVGVGTVFRLYFPASSGVQSHSNDVEIPLGIVSTKRILLVEDEEAIREVVKRSLTDAGHLVTVASTPHEALALGPGGDFDLLVTDVIMPEVSGPELAEKLAALGCSFKTLYMSGYTGEIATGRGLLRGDQALIEKPFLPRELICKIEEVLTTAPAPHEGHNPTQEAVG
jgi:PAS domain S-box-containing protein